MNIAFVGRSPFIPTAGGIEKVTYTLSQELKKRGYHVFHFNLNRPKSDLDDSDTISKTYSPSPDYTSDESRISYYKFLDTNKINLIINQDGMFETSKLFINIENRLIRIISVIHTSPIFNYQHLWYLTWRIKNKTILEPFKWTARILLFFHTKKRFYISLKNHYEMLYNSNSELCLLSPSYCSDIQFLGFNFGERLHCIANPNTYDDDLISQRNNKQKKILFIGRIDNKSKQLQILLKIWKYLYKSFNDWELIIMGDGPNKKDTINMAQKWKLKNIYFKDNGDPKPLYSAGSILCLTSILEGFPMVITEAQQFGIATIAFNSFSAASDLIDHGVTGFLVKPFSIKQYIKFLKNLMENDALRKQMGINAKQQVKRFNKTNIISQWEKLIMEK